MERITKKKSGTRKNKKNWRTNVKRESKERKIKEKIKGEIERKCGKKK